MSHTIRTVMGKVETAIEPPAWWKSAVQAHCREIRRDDRTDDEVRDQYVLTLAEKRGIKLPKGAVVEIKHGEAEIRYRTTTLTGPRRTRRGRVVARIPLPDHFITTNAA